MTYTVNDILTITSNCNSEKELDNLRVLLEQYGYPSQPESFKFLINIRSGNLKKKV